MVHFVYQKLRDNLERDSGRYSHKVLKLFDSYIQTREDLPTIDNNVVIWEVLELLETNYEAFRSVVPGRIRKRKLIRELDEEVLALLEDS